MTVPPTLFWGSMFLWFITGLITIFYYKEEIKESIEGEEEILILICLMGPLAFLALFIEEIRERREAKNEDV